MRLLKQDKRRRGETIGKLLRCLDDMKDQGKLDETKLTDGRLLLAATINTRGLSTEDRIYAAVEAMESERGKPILPLSSQSVVKSQTYTSSLHIGTGVHSIIIMKQDSSWAK